jgi:hypothetical protein
MDIKDTTEDLKRLIAFTGLKIVRVDIEEYKIVFILKRRNKMFKLECNNNHEMILYDNTFNELIRITPHNMGPAIPTPNPWVQSPPSPYTQPYITTTYPPSPPQWTFTNSSLGNNSWKNPVVTSGYVDIEDLDNATLTNLKELALEAENSKVLSCT